MEGKEEEFFHSHRDFCYDKFISNQIGFLDSDNEWTNSKILEKKNK